METKAVVVFFTILDLFKVIFYGLYHAKSPWKTTILGEYFWNFFPKASNEQMQVMGLFPGAYPSLKLKGQNAPQRKGEFVSQPAWLSGAMFWYFFRSVVEAILFMAGQPTP